jgi:hypothetical protein
VNRDDPFEEYQGLYRDIAFGYSRVLDKNKSPIFIKHIKELEKEHSYENYEIYVETAERKGLKREKDIIKDLIEAEIWTKKEEDRIFEIREELSKLSETLNKLIIKKQKETINSRIRDISLELMSLEGTRKESLGLTAEGFANKKQSEDTILYTFFKNDKLTEPLYSKEEFDLLTDEEVAELSSLYFKVMFEDFGTENLRKISISPFFMTLYHVCDDSIFAFFGRPVLQLSHLQVALFTLGKYYKNIMKNSKPCPESYQKSPEGLLEWFEMQNSLQGAEKGSKQAGDGGGRSIIGASKEELKTLEGSDEEVVDLSKAIAEHGGEMDFEEILKMHGV